MASHPRIGGAPRDCPGTLDDVVVAPLSLDPAADRQRGLPVPPLLRDLTGWVWRIFLLVGAVVLLLWVARSLYLVSLPVSTALILTALLSPVVSVLRRFLPRPLAVLITVVVVLGAVGGLMTWVVRRAVVEWPALYDQIQTTIADLPLGNASLLSLRQQALSVLAKNRATLTAEAFTGLTAVAQVLTGVLLTLLLTVILLADGDRMWWWLVDRLPVRGRARAQAAGWPAWQRLAGWIRGTFVIAAFHSVVTGISLWLLGVPLVVPLAVLIFFGSFIPLVGSLLIGGLAVLVTLATNGLTAGLVLSGILLIDSQIEAHLLQPFLVGRYVKLHPFVVAVVITAGGLLWGIAGVLLAVPLTAAGYAAATHLRGVPEPSEMPASVAGATASSAQPRHEGPADHSTPRAVGTDVCSR